MKEFLKNYDYLLWLKYIAYLVSLFSLLSFFARHWLYFELINSFCVYYFYLLLALSIPFFIKKKFLYTSTFLFISLLNGSQFIHFYFKPQQLEVEHINKVFVLNVFTANKDHQKVLSAIKEENPDFIVLTEINQHWFRGIYENLISDYPYTLEHPRTDNFGIMFLSKQKFEGEKIFANGLPVIKALFPKFTLLGVHPLPPINKSYFKDRNKFLSEIKTWIKGSENVLVCGDFNTVPWSPFFKDLLKENKLKNCSQGHGINTTWPTNIPFLRIPIDHCLISQQGSTISHKRGNKVGSDHFPIIVEFGFPE